MFRFVTAGESHGQALIAWISGLPAGVPIDFEFIQVELHRRQLGYGRGGRQKIEKDRVEALAGIRHGQTIGAPIALRIENRDWANWEKALPVENPPAGEDERRPLTAPRPGHADLAGAMKFNFHDARYILERASARETAARVAAGAIAKLLLRQFDCTVLSHVIAVGKARLERAAAWSEIQAICANLDSPLRCVDPATEDKMKGEVDLVHRAGNTVGGIFEVVAHNVITGLGSHAQWDEKLDGRLAQAVMSIQAVKGVEIGAGIAAATSYGSEVMDEIGYDASSQTVHARQQPRRRARGRHHQWRRRCGARIPETDLHVAKSAAHCGHGDQAAHYRRVRTLRCLRGAGRRRRRRGHGVARAGASAGRKIRRRFAGRDTPQF